MLTAEQLQELRFNLESDCVERKRQYKNVKDDVRETICAFANDLPDHRSPGHILIGIENDGSCSNLAITDELLTELSHIRSDGLLNPWPHITVEQVKHDNCNFVVLTVNPSDNPPVKFRGRCYVRVGPATYVASPEEETRLTERRRWGALAHDMRPCAGATIADLDLEYFSEDYLRAASRPDAYEADTRPIEAKLISARMLRPDGVPTNLGVLLVGHNPRVHLPGAYVQVVRYDGATHTSNVLHQAEFSRRLAPLITEVEQWLNENVGRAIVAVNGVPIEARQYPHQALQELIRNAIIHRTYEATNAPVRILLFSDRLEIHSPGGPYGQVSLANFGNGEVVDYRNPNLGSALKDLGYVERFGRGIPKARQLLLQNKNQDIEFLPTAASICTIVRPRP